MKPTKLQIYAVIITIILLLVLSFYAYNYFGNKLVVTSYNNGYNQATIDIISSIQQTGNIPVFSNQTGNITIQTISIQEICGGGG